MLIDWFTVGAQALNFGILVWLMKRFLYQPVLDAIDAREKHIAAELGDADAKKADALRERDEFHDKNAAFDRQRVQLLAAATAEAEAEGRRLSDEAAKTAEDVATRRQRALEDEAAGLDHALGLRTRQEVFAIARATLADLASVELEDRVSQVFIERLLAVDGAARERLAEAIRTATAGGLLRSAFELSAPQRAAIGRALNETFAADLALRFESAPDLVAGIELIVNGQKLEWNIAHYVESLARSVNTLVSKAPPVQRKAATPQDRPDSGTASQAQAVRAPA